MMLLGQLYIVETRAILKDKTAKVSAMYLVSASDLDDARRKMTYLLDLAVYASFSIKAIKRVKPNFHVVYSHSSPLNDDPAHIEPDGLTTHETRTNQPNNADQWAIGIAGAVTAVSRDHALRKLGLYLASVGTGAELHTPLHDGIVHAEEIGAGTLHTMARDISHFKRAWEVRVASV